MVDLQRYRATSGGRNFIERIKAPIILETVLAVDLFILFAYNLFQGL